MQKLPKSSLKQVLRKSDEPISSQFEKSPKSATNKSIPPIVIRTLVHVDLESNLFQKVAQAAYSEHLDSLIPCGKCGRTFFPDRICRHEENCNAKALIIRTTLPSNKQQSEGGTGKKVGKKYEITARKKVPVCKK